MKFLGQHFLKNKSILGEILGALEPAARDMIVEIGPGHGELTEYLVGGMRESKIANITAIEKDRRLVELLMDKFSNEIKNGSLKIVEGDALKMLPQFIETFSQAPGGTWKLVGNIPYYITGKLLRTVGELAHKPERSIFMVQSEVADRMCAAPPHMNRLAASVQFWADVKVIAKVPKANFSPPPEVDSAVILLKTKLPGRPVATDATPKSTPITPDRYYKAVRTIFAQPRKTILNNLAVLHAENGKGRAEIENFIKKIGLSPAIRPQNLALDDILAIACGLF